MKFFNSFIPGIVATVALLFSACNKAGQGDYMSAIPAQSSFVWKMNLQNLSDKSEIWENPLVKQNLDNTLEYLSTDTRQVIEKAIDDPTSTGIDFRRPMVIAIEKLDRPRGMLLFAVEAPEKLTDFLKTLLADEDLDLSLTLDQTGDIHTLVDRRDNIVGAYDGTKFVLAYGGRHSDASEYFELSPDEQAIASKEFDAFARADQDIAFYYDYAQILKMNPYFSVDASGATDLFSDVKMLFTINFEAGRMVFETKVFGNDALEKLNEKTKMRPTGKYLAYVPAKVYGVVNGGLRNLSAVIEYMPSDLRQTIEQGLDSLGTTVEVLDKIEGDFTLAVLPMQKFRNTQIPQFFAAVECKDSELFDRVVDKIKQENPSMKTVADRVYALGLAQTSDEEDYYLAYLQNTVFVLPANLYGQLADGDRFKALAENFTQNPLASMFNEKSGLVVDFQSIADDMERMGNTGIVAGYYLRMLKDLIVKQVDNMTGEGTLDFTDSETNALKQITDVLTRAIAGYLR